MPEHGLIIVYICVFAIGAIIGSFLNILIYRLPRGLRFIIGLSFCPRCNNRLFLKDIIPIVSYMLLRRKCRYCREPISPRYMIVELTAGVLAVLSWASFGPGNALLYFSVFSILLAIAWIDHDTMEIPDSLNIALAICGIISIFAIPDTGWQSHLIGIAIAALPLFIIALFIDGAFGFGDVKLMAAAGLFLGWKNCLAALFIGIILGGIYGVYLLAAKKKGSKEHFAFGPSLCVGIGVTMLIGDSIIGWYFGY